MPRRGQTAAGSTPTAENEMKAAVATARRTGRGQAAVAAPPRASLERNQDEQDFAAEQKRLRIAQAKHLKSVADWSRKKHKPGELPPISDLFTIHREPDPSIPLNLEGEDIREPGYRYKWVPDIHQDGKPVVGQGGEVARHRARGYEAVKVDEAGNPAATGKTCSNELGVLMRVPTMKAAEIAVRSSPTGSFSAEDHFAAEALGSIEEINRVYGRHVIRATQEEEHGGFEDQMREDQEPDAPQGGWSTVGED
jgi:hypothetical protein